MVSERTHCSHQTRIFSEARKPISLRQTNPHQPNRQQNHNSLRRTGRRKFPRGQRADRCTLSNSWDQLQEPILSTYNISKYIDLAIGRLKTASKKRRWITDNLRCNTAQSIYGDIFFHSCRNTYRLRHAYVEQPSIPCLSPTHLCASCSVPSFSDFSFRQFYIEDKHSDSMCDW